MNSLRLNQKNGGLSRGRLFIPGDGMISIPFLSTGAPSMVEDSVDSADTPTANRRRSVMKMDCMLLKGATGNMDD